MPDVTHITAKRKSEHIEICRDRDVESTQKAVGFKAWTLRPLSLPELDWADIDCSQQLFGRKFEAPFFITGMTGGTAEAHEINRKLAASASSFGIPMGVGSQRAALENDELSRFFHLKGEFPELFLIGNIGIAQLLSPEFEAIATRAIAMIDADALAIHINVLQELVQPEGDRNFKGALKHIEILAKKLPVPLIVKEVGVGVDPKTAHRLMEAGVSCIDVGGAGGTSWPYIEGLRSRGSDTERLGSLFRDFGISTADSLRGIISLKPEIPITATGGIRSGMDVAIAVALGANMAGIGLPLLRAASISEDAVKQELATILRELKTIMLVSGSRSLDLLSEALEPR